VRRAAGYTFEVVPSSPLAANTTYTLHGSWTTLDNDTFEDDVTFTTGAGPLTTAPAAPDVTIAHYHYALAEPSACTAPEYGTCVSFPLVPGGIIEAAHIDDFEQRQEGYFYFGPFFANLSGVQQGTNFKCIELRARALNGTFSEPVRRCGADVAITEIAGRPDVGCTSTGLSWTGMNESEQATGGDPDAGGEPVLVSPGDELNAHDGGERDSHERTTDMSEPTGADPSSSGEPSGDDIVTTSGCATAGPKRTANGLPAFAFLLLALFVWRRAGQIHC
jgi:hypothetical protein